MLIVGGTYREQVRDPGRDTVFGSGLRAAAALSGSGAHTLITCVDAGTRDAASATATAYGVTPDFRPRPAPVGFVYQTPISSPSIYGASQPADPVRVAAPGQNVLVFGTLECESEVTAAAIVYDPQRPRGPRAVDRNRLRAGRLAVVANSAEARALTGASEPAEAAARIAAAAGAAVVVVKRGALGALVHVPGRAPEYVGPCRTDRVWPIGSGDVFSAVFAWGWMEAGLPPVEAARLASAGASGWCGAGRLPVGLRAGVTPEALAAGPFLPPRKEPVPVYLAGPFFDVAARWLVTLASQVLSELGADVFSPLHHVGVGGDEVAEKDLAGLRRSASVLALLDGADAGTVFELGYAAARGIPAVGLAANPTLEAFRMVRGVGVPVLDDLASVVYRAIWAGMGAS